MKMSKATLTKHLTVRTIYRRFIAGPTLNNLKKIVFFWKLTLNVVEFFGICFWKLSLNVVENVTKLDFFLSLAECNFPT